MHANIEELIETMKRGDQRSFQKIYEAYYPPLLGFAKTYVDKETADDIVIDKFAKLWERRAGFDNIVLVKHFLYKSVKNACIDALLDLKKQLLFQRSYSGFASTSERSIAEQIIFAEVMQQVYAEIENLSTQLRTIFKLKYIDGLKNPEIARKLNITVQNVRNQYNQACAQLRTKLLKRDPDIS